MTVMYIHTSKMADEINICPLKLPDFSCNYLPLILLFNSHQLILNHACELPKILK